MKKLFLLLFILPLFVKAQTNTTPQFKRNIPTDSLLGYSISGLTGNHWLADTAWVRKHARRIIFSRQFTGPLPSIGIKDDTLTAFNPIVLKNDSGNLTHSNLFYWDRTRTSFEVAGPINLASTVQFGYAPVQTAPSYFIKKDVATGNAVSDTGAYAHLNITADQNAYLNGHFMYWRDGAGNLTNTNGNSFNARNLSSGITTGWGGNSWLTTHGADSLYSVLFKTDTTQISSPAGIPVVYRQKLQVRNNPASYWDVVNFGYFQSHSTPAVWGSITGTLSSQIDLNTALGLKAPLASPAFTGIPTVPTATFGTNNTQAASTKFVQDAVAGAGGSYLLNGAQTNLTANTLINAPYASGYSFKIQSGNSVANSLYNQQTNNLILSEHTISNGVTASLILSGGTSSLNILDSLTAANTTVAVTETGSLANRGIKFTDNIYLKGPFAAADYSANFVSLSYITKGYADFRYASASGFVPTSRTLTINGLSQDLTTNRTWTITPLNTDTTITGFSTNALVQTYLTQLNAASLYQPLIGYTPEDQANKVVDFSTIDNVTYPTTQAVSNYIAGLGYGTGTLTNITGVNANGFTWSIANPTTTPALTLTLQNANTSQSGQLTSTDWNTFNGKQPAGTYLTPSSTNTLTNKSGNISQWTNDAGYVNSISLSTPNVIFGTPVNFTVTSGAASGTLVLNSQSAHAMFGNHTGGSTTPNFALLSVGGDIDTTSTGVATQHSLIPYLTKAQIVAGYVPYSGATTDLTMGAHKVSAQSFAATGTGGVAYDELPSQSASPTSSSSKIRLYSDSLNRFSWKNSTYRRTIQVPYPSDYTIRMPYLVTGTTLEDSTHAATTYYKASNPSGYINSSGTALNISATSNSTLTTLSALSLPYSQLTGAPSLTGYEVTSNKTATASTSTTTYPNWLGVENYVASQIPSVPVSSVFGRTGAVVAASNDYTFAQIGTKPTTVSGYGITDILTQPLTSFTSGAGTVSSADGILTAFQKINGNEVVDAANIASNTTAIAGKQASGSYAVTTNNLSDLSNITTARANLGIDKKTAVADANYTILATDKVIQVTSITAPRTFTLPAANAVNAGYSVIVQDISGSVTTTNTVTVQRAGSDAVNGGTNEAIQSAYGTRVFISDGVSKWNFDGGIVRLSQTQALSNKDLTAGTNAFPTFNQNTTGTSSNITGTSNSTLTTLSALSLPYSQLTGTPSLTGFVPYSGATTDLTMGAHNVSAQSFAVTGTGGAGYNDLLAQSSPPSTPPTSHQYVYADANGRWTIVGSNGFSLSLSKSLFTSSHIDLLPDSAGTFALESRIIPNSNLANSAIIINGNPVSLGGSTTVTASTTAALTMNNGGAGDASGTTFNGGTGRTISYNTIGAAPLASPTFTGTVTIPNGGVFGTPTSMTATNVTGLPTTALTGVLQAAQFPALTGDITTSAGALATTLKNTGTAGTYGQVTTDAQGRVSAGQTVTDATHGGTSFSTYTTGDLPYASATNTLSKLGIGSTGNVLTVTSGVPAWSTYVFSGTASQTYTFPTTTASLARTDAAQTFIGHNTFEGITPTGATGGGMMVFNTSPTFVTKITSPLLQGGVGTTQTLALKPTTGVGATGADIIFQAGTNGGTEAGRFLNSGAFQLTAVPATSGGTDDILTRNTSTGVVDKIAVSTIPITQATADLTAQTAAGNITTFTVGASTATFNISGYINVTAVATDVIELQVTYTDENNTAQTVTFTTLSSVANSTYSPVTIRAKNATVITAKTTLTTGIGSITFDAGARITQL